MTSARREVLAGGNMEPVVRVGDTVRRVAGPWTPAVHRLLRLHETAEIVETPRALGIDAQGREALTFIPGEVMTTQPPETLWSRELLRATGRLLRRLHDASEPLVSAELTWRQPRREPAEVICHNDFALEIVGAVGVEGIDAEIVTDELLSPALRVELGRVSSDGATVVLTGLHPATSDLVGDAFALLDAAEIAFTTKEAAWSAVKRLDGLPLAQELTTLDLPPVLRDALLERAAATTAW